MDDPKKIDIKTFKMIKDFVIEIQFYDGKVQKIDFSQFQHEGWWKELSDLAYFKEVKINEMNNLEWANGQDFKPEHLYYWEKFGKYYTRSSS